MRLSRDRLVPLLAVVLAVALAALLAACAHEDDDLPSPGGGTPSAATSAPSTDAEGSAEPTALEAETTSGLLRGVAVGRTRQFLGVRFAEPPTGERRWALPEPVVAPSGTVDATEPGAACPQQATTPGMRTDEDCLFLNVTAPREPRSDDPLPVVVWWHGGGYTSGSGDQYDAQRLATRGDVVVVTANKRLGVLGYLGLPGLEGGGTFGFADQVMATQWARDNAEALGGDPDNVTVMGQSDGGMAACALLTSPAADGLVDRVVTLSGGTCRLDWPAGGLLPGTPAQTPYVSAEASEAFGTTEARQLGCRGAEAIACLRALPVEKLMTVNALFSNQLAWDTDLLPQDPAAAVAAGDVADVPVITGSTEGEERSFVAGAEAAAPGTYTAATYPQLLRAAYGDAAGRVERTYPLSDHPSPAAAFAAVISDGSWSCPTLTGARQLAAVTDVYEYEFADPGAPNVNGVPETPVPQGATHASDLPSYFDLGGRDLLRTPGQRTLADTMIDYVASFAHDGEPSADGAPAWPPLTEDATDVLRLAPGGIGPVDLAAEHHCDLWSSLAGPTG